MSNTSRNESICLYFADHGSDKQYQASLEASGDGFVVNFAFGRRGGSLSTGTKTATALPYEKAKACYDKLVREKQNKGYVTQLGAVAFTGTDKAGRATGIQVQLLQPITPEETERLIRDPRYVAQEKHDGERRPTILGDGDTVVGANRKGLSIALRARIADALGALSVAGRTVLDGEEVGDTYYCFDALEIDGENVRSLGFTERYARVRNVLANAAPNIVLSPVAVTTAEKRALHEAIQARNAEGVVFRLADAPYDSTSLKRKFVESCSAIVVAQNEGKRSVQISVLDATGNAVPIGNVTIPPNHAMPSAGDIVEIDYLYFFPGGSLYQPTYKSSRTDIDRDACTITQLKVKPTAEAA